jgi:hypothetical protein
LNATARTIDVAKVRDILNARTHIRTYVRTTILTYFHTYTRTAAKQTHKKRVQVWRKRRRKKRTIAKHQDIWWL